MEFKLNQTPAGAEPEADSGFRSREPGSFSIAANPIVQESGTNEKSGPQAELPRSYGRQSLCLMPRDAHSIFAYWDVDWHRALGENLPTNRKAHLRVFQADGSQLMEIEVEPMAASCYVTLEKADESYRAELGYYSRAGTWNSVVTSNSAKMPPDVRDAGDLPELATIPFHLSFQYMVDLLRVYKQENESLTAMLNRLRQADFPPTTSSDSTTERQDLARAIEQARAQEPAPAPPTSRRPDLWERQNVGSSTRFGNSSQGGGFGGSSRHFGS